MMKTELYYYAMSLYRENQPKLPVFWIWFLLFVPLIPILYFQTWIGLVIGFLYVLLYLCAKKENDRYRMVLLHMGLCMLFWGIEASFLVNMLYQVSPSLLITTCLFMIVYELSWILKIKLKVYSQEKKAHKTWITVLTLICGGTGVWFGKLLARVENTDVKLWSTIFLCSALIVGSVSYFQKYFILKIMNMGIRNNVKK